MSGEIGYADIVILALVAGFILLRLRSVLGQNPELPERTVVLPLKPQTVAGEAQGEQPPIVEEDESVMLAGDEALPSRIKDIRKLDPSFSVRSFLEGAKGAFEMILDAFSKADRKTLKLLLSDAVCEQFLNDIKQRKEKNTRLEITLISINKAEIVEANTQTSHIQVTVRFTSEQVHLVRNPEGEIMEGNPSENEQVIDVWTFERDAKSGDPNWKLVATR
jgi:predicted lipid-binding transport protein (Tim44 family)